MHLNSFVFAKIQKVSSRKIMKGGPEKGSRIEKNHHRALQVFMPGTALQLNGRIQTPIDTVQTEPTLD
jgi:hypothetical protein